MIIYDCSDCVKSIRKAYPLIPLSVIRKILVGEEKYMKSIKLIDFEPSVKNWKCVTYILLKAIKEMKIRITY